MSSVQAVKTALALLPEGDLAVSFCLNGKLDDLRIPPARPRHPTPELWRHSCFEVFVMGDQGPAYREFNLSPSGAWAAYTFEDYRQSGGLLEMLDPGIDRRATAETLKLEAVIGATALPNGSQLQIGLAAVVEDTQEALSYWALAHPSGRPDFHRSATFLMNLDRVTREIWT